MNQVEWDEKQRGPKLHCVHAGGRKVEDVGGRSVVTGEGGEAFGARNREGKFAEDGLGGPTVQDGVCALSKTHPAVASQ